MVVVFVADQNEIGLGKLGVVCDTAVRVHMDDSSAKIEHQASVPQERDLQITCRGFNDVRFKLLLCHGAHKTPPLMRVVLFKGVTFCSQFRMA